MSNLLTFKDRCSRINEEYNSREQKLSKQYEEREKQLKTSPKK